MFNAFIKGINEYNKPFLLSNNQIVKNSTPTNEIKGVDTMKKNCYKRKDGRWQYAKQENGLSYYAIANTYRELIEKIKNIKPKQKLILKRPKEDKFTLIQYFDFYINNYVKNKKVGEKTIKEWLGFQRNYINKELKGIYLNKATTEQIQNFIDSIQAERVQERIYQKIIKVLQKAFITGKIKKDITLGLEKPIRKNKQTRTPLTPNEQKAFINKIKNTKYYAYFMFSLIVGSRREETLKFNLETDLNEEKQTIHIKGTKTDNADRYVKISKEFINFLKTNMITNSFKFNEKTVTYNARKIFKELNIQNKCLHCLRHTCSANLYFLGADDKYRQMQLGHSSIITTNNIYTNIKEKIPKEEIRQIYGELYPIFD